MPTRSLVLITCAAGLLPGCREQPAPGAKPRGVAVAVRVAPVRVADVVYAIEALGSLEAEELIQVPAEVEGAVSGVQFHEGDRVSSATVLLRIDPERYRLEAERADASYKKALADQNRALEEWQRREQLAKEQLVSVEDLTRAKQESERLAADTAAAKAALDWALENRRRSEVKAPRAGVINTRNVVTGQFAKNGDVLATIVDTSRLRLRFKLSDGESLRVRAGDVVSFIVASLGERRFEARVYHVGQVADTQTRQVEVLAWVENPGVLKPGFFAEVKVATEAHKGALVVPQGAIQASERGFITYVVDGAHARLRLVKIGLRTKQGDVEILDGVGAGDTVVTEGSDRLADGIAVSTVAGGGGAGAAAP